MTDDLTTLLARSREVAEKVSPERWYDREMIEQSLPLGEDGDAAYIVEAHPQAWLALLDVTAASARIPEIMGAAPRLARFSEHAYEELFVAAEEIAAALSRLAKVMEGQ